MDKTNLLKTAGALQQISSKALDEYQGKSESMIDAMNTLMLNRSDINILIGSDNLEMMKDNHANHARFMISIMGNFDPETLVDTVLWVFRAYRSHGFTTNYWAAQLNNWIVLIKENLSDTAYHEILPFYNWLQVNIPLFVKLSDEKLEAPNSLH